MNRKYCPICKRELNKKTNEWKTWNIILCKNSCFEVHDNSRFRITFVFGEKFTISKKEKRYVTINKGVKEQIDEKIRYWKESDRYVAEILSR